MSQLAHLPTLIATSGTTLVGIAEPGNAGREYAKRHAPSATLFQDFKELLSEIRPQAVVIALPTALHRDAAVASFTAGANVYLEKPIAGSLDDARAIHEAWRASGLIGRIGFNCRFNRLYMEMKAAILAQEAGSPVAVRSALTARWPNESAWRVSAAAGGGALLELASHHIDLMRFIFDTEVAAVSASRWSNRGEDEAAMLQMRLENGIHAQTLVSYGTREEDSFEIYCSEGKLAVNRYDSLIVDRSPPYATGGLTYSLNRFKRELSALGYGMEKRRAAGNEPSYAQSLGQFLTESRDSVHGNPNLDDGLRALVAVDAARRSAVEQRTVELT